MVSLNGCYSYSRTSKGTVLVPLDETTNPTLILKQAEEAKPYQGELYHRTELGLTERLSGVFHKNGQLMLDYKADNSSKLMKAVIEVDKENSTACIQHKGYKKTKAKKN